MACASTCTSIRFDTRLGETQLIAECGDTGQAGPAHVVYLAPDALRVLGGAAGQVPVTAEEGPLVAT